MLAAKPALDLGLAILRRRQRDGSRAVNQREEARFLPLQEFLNDHGAVDRKHCVLCFATGDRGRQVEGGYVIWNDDRLHPTVARILEGWTPADWRRRTGYLANDSSVRLQTRPGVEPASEHECEFYDFARRYGQSWLVKPDWSLARSDGSASGT